jgi:hypothetical protein
VNEDDDPELTEKQIIEAGEFIFGPIGPFVQAPKFCQGLDPAGPLACSCFVAVEKLGFAPNAIADRKNLAGAILRSVNHLF